MYVHVIHATIFLKNHHQQTKQQKGTNLLSARMIQMLADYIWAFSLQWQWINVWIANSVPTHIIMLVTAIHNTLVPEYDQIKVKESLLVSLKKTELHLPCFLHFLLRY